MCARRRTVQRAHLPSQAAPGPVPPAPHASISSQRPPKQASKPAFKPPTLTLATPAPPCSRAGAKKLAYLDFDGHLTSSGTLWNRSVDTPPFDRDGNLAGFSETELREIVAIWRAVAEDFAPFDIDITTGGLSRARARPRIACNAMRARPDCNASCVERISPSSERQARAGIIQASSFIPWGWSPQAL